MQVKPISNIVDLDQFLELRGKIPLIDVRSPGEFTQKGAVEGAVNVPLFDDQQRAEIGTVYKQQGREKAVRVGLEMVGPNLTRLGDAFLEAVHEFPSSETPQQALMYCARGGMRSSSAAWLLENFGVSVLRLADGYKGFRQGAIRCFAQPWDIRVVTGMTGAGKTLQLQHLRSVGEQVIDLEGLANHRGSAFGGIGLGEQPPTIQFENRLFDQLLTMDPNRTIWVEDESRAIGRCQIPLEFYNQIRSAPAVYLEVSQAERVNILMAEYGKLDVEEMCDAINRIRRRLGGQNADAAIQSLRSGGLRECCHVLLEYYDRTYARCKIDSPRTETLRIEINDQESIEERSKKILDAVRNQREARVS